MPWGPMPHTVVLFSESSMDSYELTAQHPSLLEEQSELFGERNASDLILTSGAPPDVRSLLVSA